jgi:hypothetical protein
LSFEFGKSTLDIGFLAFAFALLVAAPETGFREKAVGTNKLLVEVESFALEMNKLVLPIDAPELVTHAAREALFIPGQLAAIDAVMHLIIASWTLVGIKLTAARTALLFTWIRHARVDVT